HQAPVDVMPDFQTLVFKRLDTLDSGCKRILENDSLPAYLPKRRWFANKDASIDSIRICYSVPFGDPQRPVLFSEIAVESVGHTACSPWAAGGIVDRSRHPRAVRAGRHPGPARRAGAELR